MDENCVCGHIEDEHNHGTPGAPNDRSCAVEDCGCAMFEAE